MPDTPLLNVLALHADFKHCGPACHPRDLPEAEWKHTLEPGCAKKECAVEAPTAAFVPAQREPEEDGTFAARVRTARRLQGLTLQQAADTAGVSLAAFANAECGARPRQGNRAKLVRWLEHAEDGGAGKHPIGSVGELLRAVLAWQGLTQAQVAEEIGVTQKHMSQVITGIVRLSCELAIALERSTGVPAAVWNAAEAAYRDARIRQASAVAS